VLVVLWLHKEQGEKSISAALSGTPAGDALASIGVIIGAIIIMTTGLYWVDAAVSVLISIIILVSAFGIFREGSG